MVKNFAIDITDYIEKKVEAVKKIGLAAEESSLDFFENGSTKEDMGPPMSSVHISDEISQSPEITDAIKWSRSLDQVFWDNKKADRSIFGQFFGSSTGFMRHFPVMGKEKPEIDPRHRDWYTLSATGPKVSLASTNQSVFIY